MKTKFLAGILLIAAILFSQTGTVFAAPLAQDTTPITGTIVSIIPETDELGMTIVALTLVDEMGVEQTLYLSLDDAVALGLVTVNTDTMEPVVDETQIGIPVEIDPTIVIPSTEELAEESNHPISIILAAFFGVDASLIDSFHNSDNEQEQVYGFGNIAQALWMAKGVSNSEDGTVDPETVGLILQAKTEKDFTAFFEAHPEYLVEGESAPTNWGQFKKLVSEKKNNLGSVVSGKADKDTDDTTVEQSQPGNGNDKNNDKGNKDKDKGKDKGNKDKDKGKK